MSSPAMFDYDREDVSRYAPPWARRRSAPQATKSTAERIARLPSPPPFLVRQGEERTQLRRAIDLDAEPTEEEQAMLNIMRRRSLDPEPVPPPPIDMREERRIHLFRRLALPVAFSALAAFVIVAWLGSLEQKDAAAKISKAGASIWPSLLSAVAPRQPVAARPRLRLPPQNRSNFANRPIPLGIGVTAPVPGASVVLTGLSAGTRLTVGAPSGDTGWRIATGDIEHAFVVPPLNFVGPMDLAVDLRLANDAIADRNVLRMNWTQAPTNVEAKSDKLKIANTNSTEPAKTATKSDAKATTVDRDLGSEEIVALLKRGKDLIGRSDISAARLVLRRAAEGGSARAAFALAASYDPAFLDKIGVVGAKPDHEKARAWYAKAAALGSAEAPQHAERLAHQAQ